MLMFSYYSFLTTIFLKRERTGEYLEAEGCAQGEMAGVGEESKYTGPDPIQRTEISPLQPRHVSNKGNNNR